MSDRRARMACPRRSLASERAISPTGIPTSNCINRNIARYRPRPAPRRDYIGKRFCNAVHANWTKIRPAVPVLRSRSCGPVAGGPCSAARIAAERKREHDEIGIGFRFL